MHTLQKVLNDYVKNDDFESLKIKLFVSYGFKQGRTRHFFKRKISSGGTCIRINSCNILNRLYWAIEYWWMAG